MLKKIHTAGAPAAIGPYSQAIWEERGGLLFVSGQIGLDPATGQLVPGGAEAELRQIVRNVESILEAAGLSWRDVVRTVLMLADLGDFAALNAVYAEFLSEPYPARSTLQAAALPRGARVELEVTAVRSR
jgi:2-iminobutanoate/2-iminopropanoate deaminase